MNDMTLTWTKEKPTKEGFYWLRPEDRDGEPEVVEVSEFCGGGTLYCFRAGNDYTADIEDGFEWAGPIPEPQEAWWQAPHGDEPAHTILDEALPEDDMALLIERMREAGIRIEEEELAALEAEYQKEQEAAR